MRKYKRDCLGISVIEKSHKIIISLVLLSITVLSTSASATNNTQISRYATVDNKTLIAQAYPLKSIQQMRFPLSVQTIGDAVKHWLIYSGYHLGKEQNQSKELKLLMSQTLPQIDRELGPISIESGLSVLLGKGLFRVSVNHIGREINFKRIKKKQQRHMQ